MKLLCIISAGLFSAMTALSFGVHAADSSVTPEAQSHAAETQNDKAPAKRAKRHSHVEEKTGMAMPESATAGKSVDTGTESATTAKKDKRHLHPRDGK